MNLYGAHSSKTKNHFKYRIRNIKMIVLIVTVGDTSRKEELCFIYVCPILFKKGEKQTMIPFMLIFMYKEKQLCTTFFLKQITYLFS